MPEPTRRYKYLDVLTTMFVVILLVSNLVAQKICMIGPFAVTGAVLLFPITYIFGDIFTDFLKVGYEVLATPITYFVIGRLKSAEHADAFDRGENFNPFHLAQGDPDSA